MDDDPVLMLHMCKPEKLNNLSNLRVFHFCIFYTNHMEAKNSGKSVINFLHEIFLNYVLIEEQNLTLISLSIITIRMKSSYLDI